ncbi:MAG: metallophosphoesterase [Micrococcales bacterium]|nr:metallophosphoesterase [Micrococcales bacterium]
MTRSARLLGAAVGVGAGALAWALVEARWYVLRAVDVPVLAPGQDELRVLHLSDLHLTPRSTRLVDWVRDLDVLDPHLVVSTGDLWAHPDAMSTMLRAMEPHLARPGVFVLGSNDYHAPRLKSPVRYLRDDARLAPGGEVELPWREMVDRFTSAGWRDLSNRRATLDVDGRHLTLVGTDDAHLDRDQMPDPAPRTGTNPQTDTDLHVGVTHAPYRRVLDAFVADGVDLALAGHTHGGQLAVPGYGALTTNCDLDTRRAKGLNGWPGARPDRRGGAGSMWLHVSAGLGTSPYTPVRFACRPEATLLRLVPVAG